MPIETLEWKQHGEKRITSFIRPGWSHCGRYGENCKHEPKGDHGVHNDEWVYAVWVPSLRSALVLTVHSDGPYYGDEIRGSDLSMCCGFPVKDADIKAQRAARPHCAFIDAPCWTGYSTSLDAHEFFAKYGLHKFAQVPAFYDTLCAKLEAIYANIHVDRLPKRCEHCEGRGLIGGEP